MSFTLPRRLTQPAPAANKPVAAKQAGTGPEAPRARDLLPGPSFKHKYCAALLLRLLALWRVGMIGLERVRPVPVEWAWAAAPAWLRLRRALLFFAEARLSHFRRCSCFFFFVEASPFKPKGADCVCRSATSAAVGGRGALESTWHFALLRLLDAGAVAIARLVCRRSGFKWIGGRLIRVGNCLRQRTRILRS